MESKLLLKIFYSILLQKFFLVKNLFMIFSIWVKTLSRTIWTLWKQTASAAKDDYADVHTRLMKKNYKQVSQLWFYIILVLMLALAMVACEGFGKQLRLPWWGLLLACGIALFFTLPIGIILATTNAVWISLTILVFNWWKDTKHSFERVNYILNYFASIFYRLQFSILCVNVNCSNQS